MTKGYLITAEEIAAMEGLAKVHFQNPNARRINKSLGDLTGLTGDGVVNGAVWWVLCGGDDRG